MIEIQVQPTLDLSAYQRQVLEIPEDFDVFLGGGRGSGKSYALVLLCLRHIEQYGPNSRILYIRKTYKGLADFESLCRDVFGLVYSTRAKYNQTEHLWRFPNGGYLELGQLESEGDYAKYQGRSFNLLLVDEAGQYSTPALLDRLRSNLRGPKDLPIRAVMCANPGGPGHQWLSARYVFQAAPWAPFAEDKSGKEWVYAPGTYLDNPHIDQGQYQAQLTASCPNDPELLEAWLKGDWSVSRGAYFAGTLSEKRSAFSWEPGRKPLQAFDTYVSLDWGSTAPAVAFLFFRPHENVILEPGRVACRGSVLLVDELSTARHDDWSVGLGWTTQQLADAIIEMCRAWRVHPRGVVDAAVFGHHGSVMGSIGDEIRRAGVWLTPSRKGSRVAGWQKMRGLMADAGKVDKPGLYVSRRCKGFWETVPHLGRDSRRPEDIDTGQPDHWGDAARYGVLYEPARPSGQRFWR